MNNYSFWIDFSDANQIIICVDLSVFDIIWLFIANHVKLFTSLCFALFYNLNHLFFDSFRLVQFGQESTHKKYYSPKVTKWQPPWAKWSAVFVIKCKSAFSVRKAQRIETTRINQRCENKPSNKTDINEKQDRYSKIVVKAGLLPHYKYKL